MSSKIGNGMKGCTCLKRRCLAEGLAAAAGPKFIELNEESYTISFFTLCEIESASSIK